MNWTKLGTTPSLLAVIALAGCVGAPDEGADASDENIGEAQEAICDGDHHDALVTYGGGSPGTQYFSTSANPTDQYSTCTGRYVVNVDNIDWYDDYDVVAGYAGPTPTTQSSCQATRVTAKAYGHVNDWGWYIFQDTTDSGVWLGSYCLLPRISVDNAGMYNGVQVRVKSFTTYHGVETAQKGYGGVQAN